MKRIEEGNATAEDFKMVKIGEEEVRTRLSKEDRLRLLDDELEFNKEVQIFVMNQSKKRKLTTNFIVGTLNKLAWGIMMDDLNEQINYMVKLRRGGR